MASEDVLPFANDYKHVFTYYVHFWYVSVRILLLFPYSKKSFVITFLENHYFIKTLHVDFLNHNWEYVQYWVFFSRLFFWLWVWVWFFGLWTQGQFFCQINNFLYTWQNLEWTASSINQREDEFPKYHGSIKPSPVYYLNARVMWCYISYWKQKSSCLRR